MFHARKTTPILCLPKRSRLSATRAVNRSTARMATRSRFELAQPVAFAAATRHSPSPACSRRRRPLRSKVPMTEAIEQWMRRVYKPARFRNEPGFHADREQRLIADRERRARARLRNHFPP